MVRSRKQVKSVRTRTVIRDISDEEARHVYETDPRAPGECRHCDRPEADRIHVRTRSSLRSPEPRCSDPMFGYGIGNCAGCNRFPVVLYKAPNPNCWRCESCYRKETGVQPANLVST